MDLKEEDNSGITLVTTLRENYEGFFQKDIEGALKAWEIKAMLGHPSRHDFSIWCMLC